MSIEDQAQAMLQKMSIETEDEDGKKRTQADILIQIGQGMGDLFHDAGGEAYILVHDNGKPKTYSLASAEFREKLHGAYYRAVGRGCNRNALGDAVATLSAQAKFDGECHPVYLRVGMTPDDANDGKSESLHTIEIDTGNHQWQVIRITPDKIEIAPPRARFRRSGKPLPLPEMGEPDFPRIWQYMTVPETERPLVAAFMLNALKPVGPYPIMTIQGEQGATKSTMAKVVKRFTDPSASALRSPPREGRDLQVAAMNSWVPAWDNLSYLSPELSDDLCRLATGTAMASRKLYSDHDEVLVEIQRPCIINGIEDLATRPDLASRALVIQCQVPEVRKRESDFYRELEKDAPHIFAGLIAGLQQALKYHHDMPPSTIRMADMAAWAQAGETALGFDEGAFIEAYHQNQQGALSSGLHVSPIGQVIIELMKSRTEWEGTPSDLLVRLEQIADERTTRQRAWPRAPHALTQKLVRLAPSLRAVGIDFDHGREASSRWIRLLCTSPGEASLPSQSVTDRAEMTPHDANDAESEHVHRKEWLI